jgi:hypothetical protein
MKFSVFSGSLLFRNLPVLFLLSLFISCASNNTANQQNTNKESNTAQIAEKAPTTASDDTEELARTIKLPITPEDVLWMPDAGGKSKSTNALAANTANSQGGKRLVAVLKYSEADSAALTSQVEKIAAPTPAAIIPEEWFPEELIAQSETAGDQSLKGKQYDARDFVQAPYVKGRLIKLEQQGYFILELTTY